MKKSKKGSQRRPRSGCGSGGGGNRKRQASSGHDVALSKKLSKLLRHRIDENGLRDCLSSDGFVPLARILALPQFSSPKFGQRATSLQSGITLEDVHRVVRDNDKQRFALKRDDEQRWFIRANQGHSIKGLSDEALLERLEFGGGASAAAEAATVAATAAPPHPHPATAVHGTYRSAWPAIVQSGGLRRMSRMHVHLAAGMPEEGGVISGMRGSCELVVHVDVRRAALEGGLRFYRSSNGVILTPGLGEEGLLPLRFVARVTDRRTGVVVWPAPPTPIGGGAESGKPAGDESPTKPSAGTTPQARPALPAQAAAVAAHGGELKPFDAAADSVTELEAKVRALSTNRALSKSARKNQRRSLTKRLAAARAAAGGAAAPGSAGATAASAAAGGRTAPNNAAGAGAGAGAATAAALPPPEAPPRRAAPPELVDIGISATNREFRGEKLRACLRRARGAGVVAVLLTGTSVSCSRASLRIASECAAAAGEGDELPPLRCTVGVHPHDASAFHDEHTVREMRLLLEDPRAVAVGECGLDFNRDFSPRADQRRAFGAQLRLAAELGLPVFVHEREAHVALLEVVDEVSAGLPPGTRLPPVVVHCFTGTRAEAEHYLERGFYIGFTGTVCKQQRGAPLRELLPAIPLERIMIETDAPFMGCVKGRRSSEPMDVARVARTIAEVQGRSFEEVSATTTATAKAFFRLNDL